MDHADLQHEAAQLAEALAALTTDEVRVYGHKLGAVLAGDWPATFEALADSLEEGGREARP